MANRQSRNDSPQQGDQGIPEKGGSERTGRDDEQLYGGSDEEIRDVADDDDDDDDAFEDTEDMEGEETEEDEEEGGI